MSDDDDIRAFASDLAGGELVAVRYSLLADDDWDQRSDSHGADGGRTRHERRCLPGELATVRMGLRNCSATG